MKEGRSYLLQLLPRCMLISRKIDLQAIPPCIRKVTYLNFSVEHEKGYNELVETVRRNILMADWNDPSHIESLLNLKQWKFRATTIRNLRLSCCVAGHIIRVLNAGQDTMDILAENGLDPISEEYMSIKHNFLFGGHCMRLRVAGKAGADGVKKTCPCDQARAILAPGAIAELQINIDAMA